jgi:hypothetical protein
MLANRALPSRCSQSTVLSASAFETKPFHTAPFPFRDGDMWISLPIVCRAVSLHRVLHTMARHPASG